MATVTMSLYQALETRKVMEAKVKKMQLYRLVDIRVDRDDKNKDGMPLKDVDEAIQSGYDKTVAVLNNYIILKSAINDANAKTMITVDGETMSIANAIVRLQLLDKQENMYRAMLGTISECEAEIQKYNDRVLSVDAIAKHVATVLGDSKRDDELINKVTENYKKDHGLSLYDPMSIREKSEKELERIAEFRKNIHYALTKSNVETQITVEYPD